MGCKMIIFEEEDIYSGEKNVKKFRCLALMLSSSNLMPGPH